MSSYKHGYVLLIKYFLLSHIDYCVTKIYDIFVTIYPTKLLYAIIIKFKELFFSS